MILQYSKLQLPFIKKIIFSFSHLMHVCVSGSCFPQELYDKNKIKIHQEDTSENSMCCDTGKPILLENFCVFTYPALLFLGFSLLLL